jgi:thiamine-phosphate pyrophosphorylase
MPAEKSVRPLFPLYAILDADVAERAGWTLVDLASACLAGGARFFQVRAKRASSAWLLDAVSNIVGLVHRAGGVVIVNDRADLARLGEADGVHLGQKDLPPSAARAVLGRDAMIGLSTHRASELDAACWDPVAPVIPVTPVTPVTCLTYVAIGPVFSTTTKATGYDAVGLGMVRQAAEATRRCGLPLVAIGGITLERAVDVIGAGATSVAVIGDLLSTGDPEARVGAYVERLTV